MNLFNRWVPGELVGGADMNKENDAVLDRITSAFQTLFGVDHLSPPHGELGYGPHLGLSAGVSGFSVSVPANIPLLIWGRIVLTQAFTAALAPNATGSTRTDVLVATLSEGDVNAFIRAVRQPPVGTAPGLIVPTTCYERDATVTFSLVPGNGGLGSNAAFASLGVGQAAAVRIDVPAGAASLTSAMVTILIPSVPDILKQMGIKGDPGVQGAQGPAGPPGSDAMGFSTMRQYRLPSGIAGNTTFNYTLGPIGALPGVGLTFDLYAMTIYDLRAGGHMTLTGSGATWEGARTLPASGAADEEILELIGTATSGQRPSIKLDLFPQGTAGFYQGIFRMIASLRS